MGVEFGRGVVADLDTGLVLEEGVSDAGQSVRRECTPPWSWGAVRSTLGWNSP